MQCAKHLCGTDDERGYMADFYAETEVDMRASARPGSRPPKDAYTRDGHTITCHARPAAGGKFHAHYRIYAGNEADGELIDEQVLPLAFASAAAAKRYAAEKADYWLNQWPIRGSFIREEDGRAITYLGTYSVGHGADWQARVYCNGSLMATPGGAFQYDVLRDPDIYRAAEQVIRTNIINGRYRPA